MAGSQRTEMDSTEVVDFLDTQQTGVLSMARENDSYAIPVSFAFDEDDHDVYLRLGYGRRSTKREFVDAVDRASFLTYADTDGGWKSALARGRLEELSESSLDAAVLQSVRELKIPYFSVFDEKAQDLEFSIVRIDVTELTGIVSGGAG